jgi:hypothetical protein
MNFPSPVSALYEGNMVQYKGYNILAKAVLFQPGWWRSQGSVFSDSPQGSIHIKHLEGVIFESQQAAEAHGLELCKNWVDENLKSIDDV